MARYVQGQALDAFEGRLTTHAEPAPPLPELIPGGRVTLGTLRYVASLVGVRCPACGPVPGWAAQGCRALGMLAGMRCMAAVAAFWSCMARPPAGCPCRSAPARLAPLRTCSRLISSQ